MEIFAQDTVLEHQILEARQRAEMFSRSLNEARHQEAEALKILEDERNRWTQSFEGFQPFMCLITVTDRFGCCRKKHND